MSKLFTLDKKDFFKGLILAVGTPVLYYLQEFVPTISGLEPIYKIAISAFITYILKNFVQDSKGDILGKPSEEPIEYPLYTQEQIDAENECRIILDNVGLELVGTRPKDR